MDPTWTASDAAPPAPRDVPRPFHPEPASLARMPAARPGAARTLVVAGALIGVTAISLAVAMIGGPPTSSASSPSATSPSTTAGAIAALPATAAGPAAAGTGLAQDPVPYPSLVTAPAPAAKPVAPAKPAPAPGPAATPGATTAPRASTSGTGSGTVGGTGHAVAEHEVCLSCGTVASVKAVVVAGHATGVGAVGGGAAGALVGSQVAGRGNHTLGGFLGAIGGSLLGHHVEKQARSSTVYDVRVHMEDGSWRTVRQSKAPKVGARVDVSGQTLRPLRAAGADSA